MINISNRYTKAVLYHSNTAQTIVGAVVEANLRGADLRGADLRVANLYGADLRGADLYGANLYGANLPPNYRIASLCFGGWPITATPTETSIGCERHPNEAWLSWGPYAPEIAAMHPNAVAWWTRHREAVCAVIRDVMGEERNATRNG